MSKLNLLLFGVLFAFLFVSSCKDDEDDPIIESQVLAEYLESTDSPLMKDYVSTDLPSIIKSTDVKTLNETGQIYIIDIRSADDFAAGHIKNAVNVTLGDVLNHVKGIDMSAYEKVAVVCYTGQTAGFATSLLRIVGYEKVFSMKWGMCSWHEDFAGKWESNIGNTYATQMVTESTEKGAAGELPTLTTGKTTGQEILEARVNAILAEGYGPAKIDNKSVFDNLSNYYIVNYWKPEHYAIGHIPGAMQYTPKTSLNLGADLKTLPTDKPIVIYCYTGQTSSFMTAYLRVLGYDVKSLLFGVNGLMYDKMVENSMTVFNDEQKHSYEYE